MKIMTKDQRLKIKDEGLMTNGVAHLIFLYLLSLVFNLKPEAS